MIGQFHEFFNQHFGGFFLRLVPQLYLQHLGSGVLKNCTVMRRTVFGQKKKKNRTVVFLGQLGEILSEHSYFNFIRFTEKVTKITLSFDVYSNLRLC